MKKCLESYQEHINNCIELQLLLSELSDNNLNETTEKIQSSIFYHEASQMKILLLNIGFFLKIRRRQISNYFKLIDSILPKVSTFFTKDEIMTLFKKKEIHLKLLKSNFLTIKDIATYYGIKSPKLSFFYPELPPLLDDYPTIIEDSRQSQKYREVIEYFTTQHKIEYDPRLNDGNYDALSSIIRNDDIDSFQSTVAHNNINIQSKKVHITLFESNKCLNEDEFYIIEYAAFHGSTRVFKYLMMNEAKFTANLLCCAVCGGNSEIIHLAEDAIKRSSLNPDMSSLLWLSVSFHRYEITEYLIENYSIEIEYRNWLVSVISCNYGFFSNCIGELNDRYSSFSQIKKSGNMSEDDHTIFKKLRKLIGNLVLLAAVKCDPFFLKVAVSFDDVELNNAELESKNKMNLFNPLIYAILSRNTENAKLLLSSEKVDPDWKAANDTTPFLWACLVGNIEVVKLLVDKYWKQNDKSEKNDVNDNSHQNKKSHQNENLVLNSNEGKNKYKTIDILNLVQKSSENALHLATRGCQLEVVKYLVSLDVYDLSAQTSQGETALQSAARLGYKEIFDFLKEESIKAGIEINNDIKVSQQQFLPQLHLKPPNMFINLYEGLKNPIEVDFCLLI